MNEQMLKALSLIAAELYLQNEISIAIDEGYHPGYSYPMAATHSHTPWTYPAFRAASISLDLLFDWGDT